MPNLLRLLRRRWLFFRFGGFALQFQCNRCAGGVCDGDFVTVLKAARRQDLHHLVAHRRRVRKAHRMRRIFRIADLDRAHVCRHHDSAEFQRLGRRARRGRFVRRRRIRRFRRARTNLRRSKSSARCDHTKQRNGENRRFSLRAQLFFSLH
jgi:hypothetical protein